MYTILLTQFATTWFMVGLIWLIQVVHYPLFANVGEEHFQLYSERHQFLITFIVGPVMVAELITAIVLATYPPTPEVGMWLRLGLGLLVVIWVATAAVQVPQHGRLNQGFDLQTIQSLVAGNWVRTIAWTLRGAILLVVLSKLMAVPSN